MGLKQIALWIILFLFIIFALILLFDTYTIKTVNRLIGSENKTTSGKIEIVHVSDLHLKNGKNISEKIVNKVNRLSPDFIFLTGDIIDYRIKSEKEIIQCLQTLNRLEARHGIYYIFGNVEVPLIPKIKELLKYFENITLLENEIVIRNVNGININVIGLFNINSDSIQEYATIDINSIQNTSILLSHSPDIIYKIHNSNIKFVLSGHTHAGQICLPFLGAIILPSKCSTNGYHKYNFAWNSDFKELQYGLLKINNSYINISSGLNFGSPRFFSKNEIVHITFEY